MNYVLDSCVTLQSVLAEADSSEAARLLDEHRAGVHQLHVPDFYPVEIAAALTKAERRKILKTGEAAILLGGLLADRLSLHASIPLLPRAVEISSQAGIALYDCIYVALAEQEQCELITLDQHLVNALPGYPITHLSRR